MLSAHHFYLCYS